MNELKIQKIIKQYNGLNRSSYKLCPNKSNCIYQYPDNNTHHNCKFQHFPYDNLYLDCYSILQHIKESYDDHLTQNTSKTTKLVKALSSRSINYENSSINTSESDTTKPTSIACNELKRCLTTLNYVFMIMYRELDVIDRNRKSEPNYNIRKYHSYHTLFKYDNERSSQNIEYRNSSYRGRSARTFDKQY